MQDPKDAVEQRSRIVEGAARMMVVRAVRQQRGDPCPLLVREFIAAHGRTRWGNGPVCKLGLPIIIFLRTIAKQKLVYT